MLRPPELEPQALRGWSGGLPLRRGPIGAVESAYFSTNQTTYFMVIPSITGSKSTKAKPVENFGASGAGISTYVGARNAQKSIAATVLIPGCRYVNVRKTACND